MRFFPGLNARLNLNGLFACCAQVKFLISLSEAYFQTIYSSLCHCFARDWVSDVAWYCGYDHEARRSSPAPKAPRGNCRVEARRLGDTYGANPWRQLRGMPAVAARFRGARPAMVPRQSATSGRTVVTRISLGFAPPSAHRYRIISYRTPVARVSVLGILISLQAQFVRPDIFRRDFHCFQSGPRRIPFWRPGYSSARWLC
jgi:hypothetical protein